jgi:outer membrane murein-binding lipoprotein Lpp
MNKLRIAAAIAAAIALSGCMSTLIRAGENGAMGSSAASLIGSAALAIEGAGGEVKWRKKP